VGTADLVASPAGIAKAFAAMKPPKRLVILHDFGHLVFSDICEIGTGKGGLLVIADEVRFPPLAGHPVMRLVAG
jgi:hypothetical protein